MLAETHQIDRSPRASLSQSTQRSGEAKSDSRDRQSIALGLMNRCASGDQQALAELYALYSGYLLRLTKGIVGSTEEAEDVVQEVFLYAWRNAGRYDSRRSAVSTWLWQIARSRAIDQLRKAATRARAHTLFAGRAKTSLEPRAEDKILGSELRLRLGTKLNRLPTAQRQALELAYLADMTQTEIAAQTRTPLGTVKTRTYLAIRKLRAELEPELFEAM